MLGTVPEPLEVVVERGMLHKLLNVLDITAHPLHDLLVRLQSVFSWRLLQCCNKNCYRKLFLPTAIANIMTPPLCRERRLTLRVAMHILHFISTVILFIVSSSIVVYKVYCL